ncbi:MAG TPA: DUF2231 domain-containing protein [Edaphocola sp.]|nr:DUF2231 domain-containing protein [Edaphocola sp.]
MKSKANIKGHPVHPMLVGFPIAFFIGTLIFDLVAYANGNPFFWRMGKYLEIAGIVAGLITAIPGIVDYFGSIPPKSSAKKRGAKHGLINVVMLIVFAMALYCRSILGMFALLVIGLEIIGVILIIISGWLGGTLVFRNQIGVDVRYAQAGKWKEEYLGKTKGRVQVAAVGELKTNQMKLIHVNHQRIVIGKTEEGYVAFSDHCSHKGGDLAGGSMICGTVQCPWHGSQFDTRTGAVNVGPANKPIKVYPLMETKGKVWLTL